MHCFYLSNINKQLLLQWGLPVHTFLFIGASGEELCCTWEESSPFPAEFLSARVEL